MSFSLAVSALPAQGGQHVVDAGEGEAGVAGFGGEDALAMGVDLFGELGDALAELRGQAGVFVGEGEVLKAAGVVGGSFPTQPCPVDWPPVTCVDD
jgi:hypothetical protein